MDENDGVEASGRSPREVKVAETLILSTEQSSVITNINGQPPYDDCCESIVTCIVLLPL